MRCPWVAATAAVLFSSMSNAVEFSPARPPAWPLAVKSPYVNTWLNGDSNGTLAGQWPRFWNGQITALQGFVAVDGVVLNWVGGAPGPDLATQTSVTYTSTKTVFTFDVAAKITLTVTFLSPVYPDDLVKQSLQYSYIDVAAVSSDGASHSVQVYLDATGEWASGGDTSKQLVWAHGSSNGVMYHTFNLLHQEVFTEYAQQPAWGTWFFSTADDEGLTWQSGADVDIRPQFAVNRSLLDTEDTKYRAINDDWPAFGFAKDLGTVASTPASVLFTIGVSQDEIIQFAETASSGSSMTALWKTVYTSAIDAMVSFYQDYATAVSDASALDSKIATDTAAAGGANYTTLTTLGVRQVFAATAPAVGEKQTYLFMKEISSNGDTNTADVLFPAAPLFLYLNATLVKLLLDPLYVHQEGGLYPNTYALHDLGVWPCALGYPAGNDEPMPLEECGNMVILTLAYAQRTRDTAYLAAHAAKLQQWAGFLVDEALVPANQISTDDFAGPLANQTNLALKGLIALRAMGEIGTLTSNASAASHYTAIAASYLPQWQAYGINNASAPPHATLAYGDAASHGLLYNLYADRLLGLDFVPEAVYAMQSAFYPTVARAFGVPLDTRHDWVKSDWEMFAAAVATPSTRAMFIDLQAKWINTTPQTTPYGDLFDANTGGYTGVNFAARPVMGGTFALLAVLSPPPPA